MSWVAPGTIVKTTGCPEGVKMARSRRECRVSAARVARRLRGRVAGAGPASSSARCSPQRAGRGRPAGCGRRSRRRARPRPGRRPDRGAEVVLEDRAPRPRSGPSPSRSCRPGRSSRRPGSASRRRAGAGGVVGLPAEHRRRGGSAAGRPPRCPSRSGGSQPVAVEVLGERRKREAIGGRRRRAAAPASCAQHGQARRLERHHRHTVGTRAVERVEQPLQPTGPPRRAGRC